LTGSKHVLQKTAKRHISPRFKPGKETFHRVPNHFMPNSCAAYGVVSGVISGSYFSWQNYDLRFQISDFGGGGLVGDFRFQI